jgi:hypothetical protein
LNFSLKSKRENCKEVTGNFKLTRESFKADFRKVPPVPPIMDAKRKKRLNVDRAEEPVDVGQEEEKVTRADENVDLVAVAPSEVIPKKSDISTKVAALEAASKIENTKENLVKNSPLNTKETKTKIRDIQTVLSSNMYAKAQVNSPALNAISLGFVKDSVRKLSSDVQEPRRVSRNTVSSIISKFEAPDGYLKEQVMTPGLKAATSKKISTSFGQEKKEAPKSELTPGRLAAKATKKNLATLKEETYTNCEQMTPSRKAAVSAKRVTRSSSIVTLVLDQSFGDEPVDFTELNPNTYFDQITSPGEEAAPISPMPPLTDDTALKSPRKNAKTHSKVPTSKTASPRRSPRNEKRSPAVLPAISVLKTKVFLASPLRNSISTADLESPPQKSPIKKLDFTMEPAENSTIY